MPARVMNTGSNMPGFLAVMILGGAQPQTSPPAIRRVIGDLLHAFAAFAAFGWREHCSITRRWC